MNKNTLILASLALASHLQASPWTIEWQQVIGTKAPEPNASFIGAPKGPVRLAGTTLGELTPAFGQPADVFRWELDAQGVQKQVRQFGDPLNAYLWGTARSCWGAESFLQVEGEKFGGAFTGWRLTKRSASGKEIWTYQEKGSSNPIGGVVRDFSGSHWLVRKPSPSSAPYQVTKISTKGELAWTKDVSGPERTGYPRLLRRDPNGNLVTVVFYSGGRPLESRITVACYGSRDLTHLWSTPVEKKYGEPRDLAFGQDGSMFASVVHYDDWHTTLFKLSPKGELLGSVQVAGPTFSGWRVATDKRDHVYVAGMLYGEPGYPVVYEFDSALKQVGQFNLYPKDRTDVFLRSIYVSPDGETMVLGGVTTRWMGKPVQGPSDVFVVKCHRSDPNPSTQDVIELPEVRDPKKASLLDFPW